MSNNIDFSFFDTVYNRKNTSSVKYDAKPEGKVSPNKELIPMWIADMDFKVPPQVSARLTDIAQHGIYGYSQMGDTYFQALTGWYQRRMQWEFQPKQTIQVPGVIFGISAAIRSLTQPADSILICQPVYYPFAQVIKENGRRCVVSELKLNHDRYEMDFADIEQKIVENSVKMLLFCSPHNPVGRVWQKEELLKIAEICLKHDVFIVSDEIHSDFVFAPHRHLPMATLSEVIADRTVTCTAPSKTFNLAGLQVANLVITNPQIRKKVLEACQVTGCKHLNTMAIAAAETAYQEGEQWLDTLLKYLENNMRILQEGLADIEEIFLIPAEGTYLMWLDCRKLGLSDQQLKAFFLEEAGLWVHSGSTFGKGGSGFVRMNIACPQAVLKTAVQRIRVAIKAKR